MPESINISFSYQEYANLKELADDDRDLVLIARQAAENAYAPYSKYRVGAAVRLGSGRIVHGSNVENAAFPSGICAERNVFATIVSGYPCEKPDTVAITAFNDNSIIPDDVSPCGNCRQVMAEEEMRTGSRIRIILDGREKIRIIESVSDLLPLQFSRDNLTPRNP